MAIVLVADDDGAVLSLVAMVLQRDGFRVLRASNGLEALMVYSSYANKIDLVITDFEMPEMNGAELASRIRERDPSARILIMSGYMQSAGTGQNIAYPVLRKPFRPGELRSAVRGILPAAK
jgi:two-component system cell cycle sensor histidine kinase/response regulator CckA